jgi:neutral amino acid transport system substrate-binding protein
VIGLTSDEAAAVVPVINNAKTVAFGMTGQSEFDHIHFPFFYRLVPADLAESYAMVAIAKFKKHYKRIALAFGNDIGSQTFVGPAVASIKKAHLTLAANETLDLHATTFRTEAAKIIAKHPDVILTEALGPAEGAFLSELKQQNGGKMVPVIGTSAAISPDWYKSVAAAVGASTLSANFLADNLVIDTNGQAYKAFKSAIFAERGKVGNTGNFATYLTAPGAVHLYDGINLAALAMVAAKSTKPTDYRPYLQKVATGKVVVHTFASGVAALKKGQTIAYVGPGGPTKFNNYNESNGIFQIDTYTPKGQVKVLADLPNAWMAAVR